MVNRITGPSPNAGLILVIYLGFYFAGSWFDLASTELGLQRPGTSEKNVFALGTGGAYDSGKAWLLTIGGAVLMGACVIFAALNAGRVEERWLRQPIRSWGEFHLNPFSRSALAVTPLQFLSLAIAFPLLRTIAAANNMLVYWTGWGPLGALMKKLAVLTSPMAGFAAVAIAALVLVMVLVSPLAARLMYSWRS